MEAACRPANDAIVDWIDSVEDDERNEAFEDLKKEGGWRCKGSIEVVHTDLASRDWSTTVLS